MKTALGCGRCGTTIGPGQRFCGVCGTPVPVVCPSCGTSVSPDTRYCPQCGGSIPGRSGDVEPGAGPASPPPLPAGAAPDTPGAGIGSDANRGAGGWRSVAAHLEAVTRGEFVIERELGRGGMAAVYLARELRLNRRVALKVMSPALLSGEGMVERFRQEAVTVANLSHANIVSVHSVREVDDLHFFVMQFVEGRALDRVLHEVGPLALPLVRAILFQVGSALGYAHRRGVVHRDVKPANILIDTDGNAIVTDFGIAKVAESTSHTQTGVLIGTPSYMSPEQCMGLPVTAASDQYSLGIVAFELLAGQPPFSGAGLAVLQRHVSEPIAPLLQALAPECPPETLAALERMLAKKSEERWPSVTHAVSALGGRLLAEDDPLRETLARLARPATPDSVRVTLSAERLEVGDTAEAAAEVRTADGAALLASAVVWSTEPPELVTVEADTGRVVGRAAGRVHVRATVGPISGEAVLEVVPAAPASVVVAPPAAPFRVGDRWRPAVEVLDRRGGRLGVPTTVEPLDAARVTVADTGEVEATEPGEAGVRVRAGTLVHDVRFVVAPAAVASLAIEAPPEPLVAGDRLRCTAVARDGRGRALLHEPVTWRVSDPSRATIDADGTLTLHAAGDVTVHASTQECQATLPLRVRPAPAARVEIVAPLTALRQGERARMDVRVWDARGNLLSRPVRWSTSDAAVLTVAPDGTVEARAAGVAVVTARCEDAEGSVDVGVMGSVTELFLPAPPPSAAATTAMAAMLGDAGMPEGADATPTLLVPAGVAGGGLAGAVDGERDAPADDSPAADPSPDVVPAGQAGDRAVTPTGSPEASTPVVPVKAPAHVASVPTARRDGATAHRPSQRLILVGLSGAVLLGVSGWLLARGRGDEGAPTPAGTVATAAPVPPEVAAPAPPSGAAVATPTGPDSAGAPGPLAATSPTTGAAVSDRPPGREVPAARPTTPAVTRPPATGPGTPPGARSGGTGASAADPARSALPVPTVAPRPDASAPAPGTVTPPVRTTTAPVVAATPAAPDNAAVAAAEAESRAGIQRAIESYVTGVRERNVGAMQRVYPGMPAAMRRNWEALFSAVRSVDARSASVEIQPSAGDAGSAQLSLRVSFPNPANRRECVQVTQLRLQLARGAGGWQISGLTQESSTGSPGCG